MTNPYYADDSHKAIIGLRILSIITTLPVFPAVAWTMPAHDKVINDGVGWGMSPGLLAASAFTFLWTATVLVFRIGLNKPIHPGVYVAFDLISLLVLLAFSITVAIFIEPFFALAGVEWYALIMSLICCVSQFILLVWACWATDKNRKSRKHAARKENAVAA